MNSDKKNQHRYTKQIKENCKRKSRSIGLANDSIEKNSESGLITSPHIFITLHN